MSVPNQAAVEAFQAMKQSLQTEQTKYQQIVARLSKLAEPKQRYESQLNENEAVLKEFELLEPEAQVFKLVGPVLVKQDMDEAKGNVNKRLEFIRQEIERITKQSEELEGERQTIKAKMARISEDFQRTQAAIRQAVMAQQQQAAASDDS
eukprot:TRINITY_DN1165_c0_g1_i2.p2 TRINITY_DN1165_c0_g1~~TRINITY_DN1165_c0_g1_i2.p2  ORF type:complete len:150 (-),score=48.81 TRINITY_DN1165_c0_g1_i2:133-582(-)